MGVEDIEVRIAKLREESGISDEEALGRVIREELIARLRAEAGKDRSIDPRKIVDEDELERYLSEGWDIQAILPSGRIS